MKTISTRTINPLPFGDLEPHRFEDLVRQLAYEFRRWKSLEATGQSGSDKGIDIRATELMRVNDDLLDETDATEDEDIGDTFIERLWIFQCKREKTLPPKKLRIVVKESLASLTSPPHGFVLAVACDVSKEARDSFRDEMVSRGIEEFFLWAKGELEDLLFQPRNDRLLFAYFGISIQPRRRSLTSTLRSDLMKKRQLAALIGEETRDGTLVLLRDPTDERYPQLPLATAPPARWLLCRAMNVKYPDGLLILQHVYLAAIRTDGKWDALFDHDTLVDDATSELHSAWAFEQKESRYSPERAFWVEYIDESHRAYVRQYRKVPFERILAVDTLGDGFYPVPHILVEFADTTGPFMPKHYRALDRVYDRTNRRLNEADRTEIFPKPLPGENDSSPAAFDQTAEKGCPLSDATAERLTTLLAKPVERDNTSFNTGDADAVQLFMDEKRQKLEEFGQWREKVAHPVFSTFVHQLRAAGHGARVVIQSAEPDLAEGRDGFESVKLIVHLMTNAGFRTSGHVHISTSGYAMAWRVDVSPSSDAKPYTRSTPVTLSARTTSEELEGVILAMLEKLRA